MYKDLEKKRQYEKEYARRRRAVKVEKARATQDEIRRRIAAAIVAAELLQESNG
jgi:hypothetical protein